MPVEEQRIDISVDDIEIPAALKEDFEYNKHLEPLCYQAVSKTLNATFSHPETKMREITRDELKRRIRLCYDTIVVLRHDLSYSLRKCLDLLPKFVLQAMIENVNPADLFERDARGNAWGRGNPRRVVLDRAEVEANDLAQEVENAEVDDE